MNAWSDEELRELENSESWELEQGEDHEPVRNRRSIVSVAFPSEDFERVSAAARQKGMKLSEFIRNAALRDAAGQGWSESTVTTSDNLGGFRRVTVTTAPRVEFTTVESDPS